MERFREYQLLMVGVFLMLGIVLGSAIGTYGLIEFKKANTQSLTVTGAASEDILSDFVKWQPMISHRGVTMADAYAGLQRDSALVLQYLKENGIRVGQIKVQPPGVETVYARTSNGGYTNQVEAYVMRQSINVESPDVAKVERLVNQSMELVNRGVTFEVQQPQYFYTKLDGMKVKMLGLATENARQRAMAMAKSTGNRIGPMRSSQMGVFQITPQHSTEVSDYGINDTSTLEKKVTAVVNVTFALD